MHPQTKGDKIRSGYLTRAFLGAQKRAEVLHNACILGVQQRGAAPGRSSLGLRRGAAARGCAEQLCGAVQWWGGCVGAQRGAAQGRSSVGLCRAAVWGGAVVGGLCRGAAAWGCAGAQRVAAQGRSAGLCRGAAWGCAGAPQRGAVQGRSSVGRRSGGGAV